MGCLGLVWAWAGVCKAVLGDPQVQAPLGLQLRSWFGEWQTLNSLRLLIGLELHVHAFPSVHVNSFWLMLLDEFVCLEAWDGFRACCMLLCKWPALFGSWACW